MKLLYNDNRVIQELFIIIKIRTGVSKHGKQLNPIYDWNITLYINIGLIWSIELIN